MKLLLLGILVGFTALLIYVEQDLPSRADPMAPANTHVSPTYIENSRDQVGAHNVVTAVLADYRGYDTLGELLVIFTAGVGIALILRQQKIPEPQSTKLPREPINRTGSRREDTGMVDPYDSVILRFMARIFIVPFIFLFAFYIIIHGEESAGGGFQGGAILAAGIILIHLSLGRVRAHQRFPVHNLRNLGTIGVAIFVATGLTSFIAGQSFLDYSALPIPGMAGADLRALGVFVVEVGIALGVVGVLVIIFEYLSGLRES